MRPTPILTVAIPLLALALLGCSTTQLPRSTLNARSTSLNIAALQGGGASITLHSQPDPIKAEYFTITGDSLFWTDSGTELAGSTGFSNLGSFTILDRPTGYVYGIIGGGLVGYGLGVALDDRSQGHIVPTFCGAMVGGLIGFIIGVPRTYTIDLSR